MVGTHDMDAATRKRNRCTPGPIGFWLAAQCHTSHYHYQFARHVTQVNEEMEGNAGLGRLLTFRGSRRVETARAHVINDDVCFERTTIYVHNAYSAVTMNACP